MFSLSAESYFKLLYHWTHICGERNAHWIRMTILQLGTKVDCLCIIIRLSYKRSEINGVLLNFETVVGSIPI